MHYGTLSALQACLYLTARDGHKVQTQGDSMGTAAAAEPGITRVYSAAISSLGAFEQENVALCLSLVIPGTRKPSGKDILPQNAGQ